MIAHGVVLPRRGDELLPAASLAEAAAAVTKSLPNTAHRPMTMPVAIWPGAAATAEKR